MKTTITAVTLLCAVATGVNAQSETHTIPFSYNPVEDFFQVVQAPQFDTQGGTRQLESIGINLTSNYALDFVLENTSNDALLASDYVFEHINRANIGFGDFGGTGGGGNDGPFPGDEPFPRGGLGEGDGGGGPSNRFFDTGFFTIFDAEQDLAPYDGTPGVNAADQVTQQIDTDLPFQTIVNADSDALLAGLVTGTGTVDVQLGGIIENFFQLNFIPDWGPYTGPFGQPVYPSEEALWFRLENYLHSGDVELTYNFSIVPAPGGAGLLALAGLGAVTRRRR